MTGSLTSLLMASRYPQSHATLARPVELQRSPLSRTPLLDQPPDKALRSLGAPLALVLASAHGLTLAGLSTREMQRDHSLGAASLYIVSAEAERKCIHKAPWASN
mmetsp:Transcript_119281/g.332790  ORF Transcript_119281/g.332790 Transcript_119281/m.332790 type:complete len:105 (-) Transcript_119281:731-1045(-)